MLHSPSTVCLPTPSSTRRRRLWLRYRLLTRLIQLTTIRTRMSLVTMAAQRIPM
nr:MAG TPA: hypothetical protein [Caudoviricetes sp.]